MEQTMRQKQKMMTRQRIMDTAFQLYATNGFSTPTNLIAKETGISHGSIFAHFPTKESLQLQVLKLFAQEVGRKLHKLSSADCDMTGLLYAHMDIVKEYELFYTKLILEINSLPDESKTIFLSLQTTLSSHFGKAVVREQRAGTLKDIPLHMLYNIWLGLLHYYLQNADLFAPKGSVLNRCGDELVNTYIALIKA